MPEWSTWLTQVLWRNGLAVVPMALIVWMLVRWGVRRPATRHALWLGALVWLVAAMALPPIAVDLAGTASGQGLHSVKGVTEATAGLPVGERVARTAGADGVEGLRGEAYSVVNEGATGLPQDFPAIESHHDADIAAGARVAARDEGFGDTVLNPEKSPIESPLQLAERAPTPPTTVARPAGHVPTHLPAVHDSVGQSSLFAGSEVGTNGNGRPFECATPETADDGGRSTFAAIEGDAECSATGTHLSGEPVIESGSAVVTGSGSSLGDCASSGAAPSANTKYAWRALVRGPSRARVPDSPATTFGREGSPDSMTDKSTGTISVSGSCRLSERAAATDDEPPGVSNELKAWISAWVRVRDTVGAIPSLPASLWLSVTMLLIAMKVIGSIRFHRRLRKARPAPHGVRAMVRACATSIGLKDVPEAVLVNDRVSPMVICGWRPRLVLPVALWSELDSTGRRAVIVHELAHLRRHDHVTHWFDCLIGALYWWHPVVWWVRQRLRDEAENACDAWVTWFDPRARRAYATALLQARTFLSDRRGVMHAPAVGVMSPQAKRFSRRLTMVMTSRVSPKAYSLAMLAMPVLFMAAWVAMPAATSACPPEEKQKAVESAEPVKLIKLNAECKDGNAAVVVTRGDERIIANEIVVADPVEQPTHAMEVNWLGGWVVAGSDHPAPGKGVQAGGRARAGDDSDARLDRLERQMAELSEKLSILAERRNLLIAPTAPTAPTATIAPSAPIARVPAGLYSESTVSRATGTYTSSSHGIVVRKYELPEEKLKALTKLMSRSDVPTQVRAVPGGLEVHATMADQAKFAAFVEMISGDGINNKRSYKLPQGKLEDLTELMALDSVPVMIHPDDKNITVQGSGIIQKTFSDFLELLEPRPNSDGLFGRVGQGQTPSPAGDATYSQAAMKAHGKTSSQAMNARQRYLEVMEKAAGQRARSQDLAREAGIIRNRADRKTAELDALRVQMAQLRSRIEESKSQSEINALKETLARLDQTLEQTVARIEQLRDEADQRKDKADEFEDTADQFQDQAEELEEMIDPDSF